MSKALKIIGLIVALIAATFAIGLLQPLAVFLYLYVMAPLYHWLGLTRQTVTIFIFIILFILIPVLQITIPSLLKKRTRFGNREFPDWLRVMWQPMTDTKLKAWHPDWTCIESIAEPVVHKLAKGYWRIEFICPERGDVVAVNLDTWLREK
jgi:hypothetical protein